VKQHQGDDPQLADLVAENQHLHAIIAEMRERIVALELLADTDTLTPLPNRRRPFFTLILMASSRSMMNMAIPQATPCCSMSRSY
jgi:GGDEF domain-containing protein